MEERIILSCMWTSWKYMNFVCFSWIINGLFSTYFDHSKLDSTKMQTREVEIKEPMFVFLLIQCKNVRQKDEADIISFTITLNTCITTTTLFNITKCFINIILLRIYWHVCKCCCYMQGAYSILLIQKVKLKQDLH